jgi:fatty-acyl-CoA synthase
MQALQNANPEGRAGAVGDGESVSAAEMDKLVRRAAASSVAGLFLMQARTYPDRIALVEGDRRLTYGELGHRVGALAAWLRQRSVGQGARIAILSENRLEYLELFLAAAWIGAIVACQNWRLAAPELVHCLTLVEPEAILVSPRHAAGFQSAFRPC